MKEKVEFRKIREFGTIISDTLLFIKQNFKPLVRCFFAICGIYIIAGIISMVLYKIHARDIAGIYNGGNIFTSLLKNSVYNFEYFLMSLVSVLNYVSIYITIYSFITLYIVKGNVAPSVAEVWSYYKYYFLRIFGTTLGLTVFFVGCIGLCIMVGSAVALPLGVIMFLVFLLFVIYIFPALSILYPVMVAENGSFWYAVGRSFKLLKGSWWITAGVLIVIYIIFYMAVLVIQTPSFFLTMIGTITHAEGSIRIVYDIIGAGFTYVSQIFILIPLVSGALIYFNLVEQKESTGLLGRIETLGRHNIQESADIDEY